MVEFRLEVRLVREEVGFFSYCVVLDVFCSRCRYIVLVGFRYY